ncbi:CGCGG family rSAM-modified RiPP protein [Halonotius terrestris]|uniref:CGCGG family rSAM-modified RiPP protein n=1 Tax=Halonotius terrestris TaxID=2487750 RepID=A0A8J8TCL1_9EURY|nr:CGCGG family rSAM-modified RiPP protein [Halonotius terrestris]TQQ83633.1 CGCGG family rSAM-modified RiPP protein [Halonotius terrestris]
MARTDVDHDDTDPDDRDAHDHDASHGDDAHDHSDAEPITDRVHDTSWSANLELPQHGEDRDLLIAQAIDAIEHTEPGYHVNLVTHGDHGHPSAYLYDALDAADIDAEIDYEYIEQCGCGGHVTRVHLD